MHLPPAGFSVTSHSSTTPQQVVDHVLRPEFVVRLHVGPDQTTATLYAYRGEVAAAALLPWRRGVNDVTDHHAIRPVGVVDVIVDHVNKSRGVPYANGSRHYNWAHYHDYDEKGAMYFAIAVILFYGISIAMLVAASTLKRSHSDYELKGFLRSYARLDAERRSREKQRIRAVLQRSILMNSLTVRSASPPVAAARDVTANGTQQLPARCSDAQRRSSGIAGPPATSGSGVTDGPQFTCVVAADEQPTVHVAVSSTSTADTEKAAVSSMEPTNDNCLQTVVVVDRSPNHAGNGAEMNRKRSDVSRHVVQSPAKPSAVGCSAVDIGGSKVWPANELTVNCVGVWNCRQEVPTTSKKGWWSRSRPYSDCTLSRQLSERSFLVTGTTVSSSMYHFPGEGWGSMRDGRRNTAV